MVAQASQRVIIHRIGSSCLKSDFFDQNISTILDNNKDLPNIIVISALPSVTDRLISLALESERVMRWKHVNHIRYIYYMKALDLLPKNQIADFESFLENNLASLYRIVQKSPIPYDEVVFQGEFLSAELIRRFLTSKFKNSVFIDAETIIKVKTTTPDLSFDLDETTNRVHQILVPRLKKPNVILIPGFYGTTSTQQIVLLGRNGSDITAAVIADGLAETFAVQVIFWKDIDGIYTSDPKKDQNAKKIDQLSHQNFLDQFKTFKSVIHPKTVEIAARKKIPLTIRNFETPTSKTQSIITSQI
ncbi:MAG: hypothetical protein ACFFC7_21290 [Candidatus Hermodarchaeota archaeon]